MKRFKIGKGLLFGLVLVIALPFIFLSCTNADAAIETTTTPTNHVVVIDDAAEKTNMPPLNDSTTSAQIDFTYDQLLNQKHITQTIDVVLPGSLIITLGSNRTTGFQWQEKAIIGDPAILNQYSHQFVEPQTGLIGTVGKEVFVFKTLAKGTSTIQFQFSRPWEGGEKAEWTVDLTVIVK